MRIDNVYIEDYKNLKQFKIDLDEKELNTVLLGQNATGKSNFIECLVLIFKYLDLSKSSSIKYPVFDYKIKYKCRDKDIEIVCTTNDETKKQGYEITVDKKKETYKSFFENKDIYLPKYVFTYYSGISNKLKNHFDENQKNFYTKAKEKGVTKEDVEDFRRMFYVQLVHSYFVLLAFYTFEEDKTKNFLSEYLNIENLESVLFKFQKPEWQKKPKSSFKEMFMWGANGLVREFLEKLWEISLAPIDVFEDFKENFRDSNKQKEYLYLFVPNKEKLQELNKFYHTNTELFKALESTYISDLIDEVKVKVKKSNIDNDVTFKELSEGEQQLLTVLGLLKFTKDKETLVLLDEPDTHLNPLWKWHYLDLLNNIYKSDSDSGLEDETTQIIINTHDPLVIGGLRKEQIRIFKRNPENGIITAKEPDIGPKGLGVGGILTSKLFGLPTILDSETQSLLDERNNLLFKQSESSLNTKDNERLKELFKILNNLGFSQTLNDPLYTEFIIAYQKLNFEKNNISQSDISTTWDDSNKAYNLLKTLINKAK